MTTQLARDARGGWWIMKYAGKSTNGAKVFVRHDGPFLTRKIAEIWIEKEKKDGKSNTAIAKGDGGTRD